MATFIKELVVELPKGEKLDFRAEVTQIDVPAYKDLENIKTSKLVMNIGKTGAF